MQFVVPTQTTFESLLAVLGVSIFFEMNFKRRNSIILKFYRINPHSVYHGVLGYCGISLVSRGWGH